MELVPLSSFVLSSAGFSNGKLYVVLRKGSAYRYDNVPPNVYDELITAPSKGQYYWSHIAQKYGETRIRPVRQLAAVEI